MGAINSKGLISVVLRGTAERRLVANPTTVTLTMNPTIISELNRFEEINDTKDSNCLYSFQTYFIFSLDNNVGLRMCA